MYNPPFSATTPSRLYAILLKLRPLQQGTLMPFSGELVHGAFLRWLASAAPDVAAWLHDGNKRRLFTCSSLHFSQPMQPHLKAERHNIHLPLDPQKTYTIRLTLLLGDLFPLFYEALMQFNAPKSNATIPPFLRLGKQLFLLEEVQLTNDDPSGWTGFTSLTTLVEQARHIPLARTSTLTLEFASLTTFNRSTKTGYGPHFAMLPLPQYIIPNLIKRWEDLAPPELAPLIQREPLERYLQQEGVIITDYDLHPHLIHFTTHQQRGFLGTCTYQLRHNPQDTPTDSSLPPIQQIHLLTHLAFYTGIGYKTTMGLGQTRLTPP